MLNKEKNMQKRLLKSRAMGGTLPSLMESWEIAEKHSATSVILMAAQ